LVEARLSYVTGADCANAGGPVHEHHAVASAAKSSLSIGEPLKLLL
jgi:hypothetical protein